MELQGKAENATKPILVSAGIEDGIIFTITPLIIKVVSSCDIMYDETIKYPFLFNAVVFNDTLMEWSYRSPHNR